MARTLLKKLSIKKFRALSNIEIEFGTHITVICGKNGTCKSSILGIAAQIFSFDTDYVKGQPLSFRAIDGSPLKSPPAEHFRFSDKFDVPGSMEVTVELHDGYVDAHATAELELSQRKSVKRGIISRPVVRKNSTVAAGENSSRNFTHPVIFLSLKRLLPIATRDYSVKEFDYLQANSARFLALNNELLNKLSSVATGTSGSISSAVAHSERYDQDSVSAGEDNVGQIVLALLSFRKLREEYGNEYKGGLLLIDESDAALFPAAQLKLLDILERECQELQLQVVMTSHSPTLVERIYDLSLAYRRKFKTYYLSDTYGPVRAMENVSWPAIYADLHTTTVAQVDGTRLPKVNIYFEDAEGHDFFSSLLQRQPAKKFIEPLREVSLGCSNYIQLIKKGVPEFSLRSLVVLDGDVAGAKALKTVVLLPGCLPPDQLIFEFLFNLPPSDDIWKNEIGFARPNLTNSAASIIAGLGISTATINLTELLDVHSGKAQPGGPRLRELFKDFYKGAQVQQFLKIKGPRNPWRRWMADHQQEVVDFRSRFNVALSKRMTEGFGVDPAKITSVSA